MSIFSEGLALAPCLAELELRFTLRRPGRPVRAVVSEVQAALVDARLGTPFDRIRIAAALEEAIDAVLLLGNFEMPASALRGEPATNVRRLLREAIRERGSRKPYCDRRVRVRVHLGRGVVRIAITHDGPALDDPSREGAERAEGESLLAGSPIAPPPFPRARLAMDEAYFEAEGRTLTLARRLVPGGAGAEPDAVTRNALVVDSDSRRGGRLARRLSRLGFDVRLVGAGAELLAALARQQPDLAIVGTSRVEPDRVGSETVDLARRLCGRGMALPVFVLADRAHGALAALAMRAGAVDSIDPDDLNHELARAVEHFEGARTACPLSLFARELDEANCRFELPNEPDLISPLALRLLSSAARMRSLDPIETTRVGTALREAILNAMEHGNLEVCSSLREEGGGAYHNLIAQRRRESPYGNRRVDIVSQQSRDAISFVIRDQGPGFDPRRREAPTDHEHLERASGRGLLLIRAFMDEVRFNDAGNEITLIKRKTPRARIPARGA